jgi:hypothetical protein
MQVTWDETQSEHSDFGIPEKNVVIRSFEMRAAEIVPKGLLHVFLQNQGLGTSVCRATVSETRMTVEERARTWTLHTKIE